ncbi:sulfite transporter Ssu2 [Phyllosticta capitalensis]
MSSASASSSSATGSRQRVGVQQHSNRSQQGQEQRLFEKEQGGEAIENAAADANPAGVPPANLKEGGGIVDVSGAGQREHGKELSKYEVGWRRVVRNFSPSWFSVTMGTGIVSILFYLMPYNARWLHYLSIIFFCLNAALFTAAFVVSFLRYTLYPEIWSVMIRDPNNSLFLGTIPMGFATLIEMWVFICVPVWGPWATTLAWVLWMIDTIVAAGVTLSLSVLLMMHSHEIKSLERFTAAQLLPIAATIVAAGTGAEVAEVLPNRDHALGTIMTCYVLWGMATPLAMAVLVMYYQRLALHKMPPREVIVSCFLPLGPLGFGGYSIMYLGKVAKTNFPATGTLDPSAGPVMYVVGFFLALIMWGFGLVWFFIALVSIYKARPFPFNMGWWGFTFPLGVFAASTIQIGIEMPSRAFKVLGEIFSVAVILLWCLVAARTARGAWSGKLFFAPCLANLKKDGELAEAGMPA